MITKGILKTINYNENSCTVRIPLFETTSSTNEVVLPAIFLTQPGSYNGYSEGDVVFVDFENNSLSNPIIIGKLYLGAIKEKTTPKKGGLTIADLSVTSSATLPLDTKLTFNAADETVASVEGGYNTYKSLLDIIKALYKTETSVSKTTEEALENITKIKVEYLSQLVTDPEPLKEDPNWSISMPNYKDGYNIWQKTTCYNSKGQILSTEIICLSAANAIASYWLRCSTKIHSGAQQAETIEITAMTKLGTSPETADEESSLTYRWSKGANKKAETADPETPYKLIFRNTAEAPLPNENLIITAYRNGAIYESETIFFSPLNTPTLVLTNENASLEYDSYGFTKMPGAAEFVESTAVIKLNNETITAKSYEWTVKNCSFDSKIGTNTNTIRITDIDESSDSATATCEAIYVDNVGNEVPLTKVFSISKIKQGRSLYKLDLSNEFVTIPAVDDGKGNIKIADDYDWDYLTSHTVNAYYGDEILKVTCSRKTPSLSASEKTFHLKYTVSDTLSLNSEINQSTAAEGATFVLANLTGKTGTILYELFRGSKKVASAKFEATRLDSGTPATSYWLNISSPIHTGVRQESDIKIQPKLETGNSGQDNDILAYIRCKYVGETSYIEVSKNINTGEVTLTAPLKDKNILVEVSHTEDFSNIYESETITFSPLNTPVIDLTNDSAALTYTAGGLKINKEEGKEDVVESTATLYLNGKPVEGVTYSWTYTDCIIEGTTNSQTIKIKGLLAPKGTATCSVSYWGETFTKVFSITKQIQGDPTTSYWIAPSTKVIKINADNTIVTKTIEFQIIKKSGTKTPEAITLTSGESLKLKVGINGQTLNDFNGKATDNIYSIDTNGVSTSIIIALYDNDTEIDRETINVIKDGEDGKSAYKIDIANDFVTIPTDYSGTIQLGTNALKALATHTITLYYGEESIKPNWISSQVPNSTMGLRYTISTGLTATIPSSSSEDNTISVENITALTTDTGSILYEIVKDEKVLASANFKASKIKSGEPTSYYKLEPSSSMVVHHKDGTNSPDELKIYCYKYTGSTKEQVQDFWIRYFINDENPQTIHATSTDSTHKGYAYFKSTTGITKSLKVELYLQKLNSPTDLNGAPLIDQETIVATTDGVDGAGGDTFEVQQAFLWTSDYTYIPDLPNSSLSSTKTDWSSSKEWAFISTKYITKKQLDKNTPTWKLIFISTRVKTTSAADEESYSPWDAPTIYLCKNWDAYYLLTTAEGLFGDGQGIYYTYQKTDKVTAETVEIVKGSNRIYAVGQKIEESQKDIAAWIAENPSERKEAIKVYIDAEYIRTGAFRVEKDINNDGIKDTLFEAGINNETVIIGGFTVTGNELTSGSGTSKLGLRAAESTEYTAVSFIQATGEQAIDTGLILDYSVDSFEITTQATKVNQTGFIFGNYDTKSKGQAFLYHYDPANNSQGNISFYIEGDPDFGQIALETGLKVTNLEKHTYKFENNQLKTDDTVTGQADQDWNYTNKSTKTALIAAGWNSDGQVMYNYTGKIYGCKIWDKDNVLIREFVPAYKENTYGLYDKANNKFYKSITNKAFTGPDVKIDEFTSIYLGSNNPEDAPFSVTNTGKIKATSGEIGGFSLSATEFKTLRPENIDGTSYNNPDVLITTKGASVWGKVANRPGYDWRILVGEHFGVTSTGALFCDDADVTGNIIATSGRLEKISLIESAYLDSDKIEAVDINTTTLAATDFATIAGFKLAPVNSTSQETKSKEVSLQIITPTGANDHASGIGTYIGGNWLFTLTFACFDGTTQQSFISQHNFTDYQINYATFESNESRTVTEGSNTTTQKYVTKVYFNNVSLNAFKGQSTITSTVSGGGGGASPNSKWRLREVNIRVKTGNSWTPQGISYFNTAKSARVNIDYLNTTNNTNLLLDGNITVGGNLLPKSDSLSLGDESHSWDKLYVDEIVGTTKITAPSIYASTFYASSDKRLKENIKEFIPAKSILELPVVEFDFKDTKRHQIGCIAQDLQEICPELVTTNDNGYLNISENKLVYLLLLELKKLNSKVISLENKLKKEGK